MQVKGRVFVSAIEYAGKKYGSEKLNNFFIKYPEFEEIRSFSDLNWYDLHLYLKFSECVDKFFGFGDASLLVEIGEYCAKTAFESSHRLFKDLSMQCAMSNAQSVFLSYYSAGAAEIHYIRDNKLKFSIKNLPPSPYLGKTIHGWMKQALKSIKSSETNVQEVDAKTHLCYCIEWTNLAG